MHGSRRWRSGLALAGLSAGLVVLAPLGANVVEAAPVVDITFLNINDFHGRIGGDTMEFAATIEQQRAAAAGGATSVALLSAGDNIGASLFNSSSADDQPTIDFLNAMGLRASAVGTTSSTRASPTSATT